MAAVEVALERSWFKRGVISASGDAKAGETEYEVASAWAFSFEAGALDALRFARAILSDPACRGRELEALKMIEQGLGHAAVVAALRAPQGGQAGEDSTVVAFPAREGRA